MQAKEKGIKVAENEVDDALIYALFPQVGLKFLENRDNPDAFEPVPSADDMKPIAAPRTEPETYAVKVDGQVFNVEVGPAGSIKTITPIGGAPVAVSSDAPAAPVSGGVAQDVTSPLSGTIFKLMVQQGEQVNEGDVLLIMEAMKMETEIRAIRSGVVQAIHVREGDSVAVGDALLALA